MRLVFGFCRGWYFVVVFVCVCVLLGCYTSLSLSLSLSLSAATTFLLQFALPERSIEKTTTTKQQLVYTYKLNRNQNKNGRSERDMWRCVRWEERETDHIDPFYFIYCYFSTHRPTHPLTHSNPLLGGNKTKTKKKETKGHNNMASIPIQKPLRETVEKQIIIVVFFCFLFSAIFGFLRATPTKISIRAFILP